MKFKAEKILVRSSDPQRSEKLKQLRNKLIEATFFPGQSWWRAYGLVLAWPLIHSSRNLSGTNPDQIDRKLP